MKFNKSINYFPWVGQFASEWLFYESTSLGKEDVTHELLDSLLVQHKSHVIKLSNCV
jgi:hypothetical protein